VTRAQAQRLGQAFDGLRVGLAQRRDPQELARASAFGTALVVA
jgi:hypothetical protein